MAQNIDVRHNSRIEEDVHRPKQRSESSKGLLRRSCG